MRHSTGLRIPTLALVTVLLVACDDGGGGGEEDTGPTDATEDTTLDVVEDSGPADVVPDGAGDADAADVETGDADDVVAPPSPWTIRSLGDLGTLSDVHVVGPDEAYAVGGPRVLRFNGATWAAYGEPTGDTLYGVWADEGIVVVVGAEGLIARRTPADLTWTVEDAGVGVDLHAVDGRGPDALWAAGDESTILRYAGPDPGWEVAHDGGGVGLRDLWVPPSGDGDAGVLAVGTKGTLYRVQGGEWVTRQIASNTVTLHAVLGVGDRRVAAGTDTTLTVKADPSQPWQGQSANLDQDRDLFALAGSEADGVFAFGAAGTVLRSEGQAWSSVDVAGPSAASADLVAAAWHRAEGDGDPTFLVMGAEGGGLVLDDEEWVDMPTRPRGGLAALDGADRDGLWAAGPDGLVMASTAQGWTAVPVPTEVDLADVAAGPDGIVWVVGDDGVVLRRAPGEAFEVLPQVVPAALSSVASDGDRVVAGGKGGTVLRGPVDGSEPLAAWPVDVQAGIRAVGVGGDGAWWLAGDFGTLLRSADGEAVDAIPSGVAGTLHDLAAADGGVLVAGDNGVLLEVEGGDEPEAEQVYEDPGLFLFGVDVLGEAALAVGWNGGVVRRTEDGFAPEDSGTRAVLEAVWIDGDGALAVGRLGALLERTEAP
ncbi:MAG: hypothetical protein ACQEXJ_16045 [Myxococcota bacterium]